MSALAVTLLCWAAVPAAAAGSLYVRSTPSRGSGGELPSAPSAGSTIQCGLFCERAGLACVGFRLEGGTCRLLSGLTAGQSGTFVRGCGSHPVAYRAVPPMSRPDAEAECAADGGRMAVPLSAEQRGCVQRVVDAASATPGFLPAGVRAGVAYLGLLVHGPAEYSTTDLLGAPVHVPPEAWAAGQPNDGKVLAYVVMDKTMLFDYYTTDSLTNVCEWPL